MWGLRVYSGFRVGGAFLLVRLCFRAQRSTYGFGLTLNFLRAQGFGRGPPELARRFRRTEASKLRVLVGGGGGA